MPMARQRAWQRSLNRPEVAAVVLGLIAILCAGYFLTTFMREYSLRPDMISQTAAASLSSTREPFERLSLIADAAIVRDLKTDKVMYEKNADAQLPLASLTKVPLAIAVSEVLTPNAAIKIPYDTAPIGSAERLAKDDVWRIKDILDFTLVASSNAGSEILAEAASPAIRAKYPESATGNATLWRMNDLARELSLPSLYFINVSGLDESTMQSGAYGSARDVASLFAYASREWPEVFAGTTKDGILLTSVRGGSTSASNTDQALAHFPGLVMGKTGFTDLAGGNLAIVFETGPARPMVAVVLNSTYEGRFADMRKLVSATFDSLAEESI